MDNKTKGYCISGDNVMHMNLTSISLPENETETMLKRYRFDNESTLQMIDNSQKTIEEYKIKQEQKEYEEMNYSAICRRLLKCSSLELVIQLFKFAKMIILK